ncbi:MAG: hypothetical protein AAF081_15990 [Actinomycetota bacterium]
MILNRRRVLLPSLIAVLALVAVACSSGESTTTEAADDTGAAGSGSAENTDDATADHSSDAGANVAGSDTDDAVTVEPGSTDAANAMWPHDFVEDTVGGGLIDANDLQGQDVILWFWAPW